MFDPNPALLATSASTPTLCTDGDPTDPDIPDDPKGGAMPGQE